jgi:peptide deformylase
LAIRDIRKQGDEALRKAAKPVQVITSRIHTLLDDMAETLYDVQGVGLAANQVGVLKRVVVIDVGEGLVELINPEIITVEGEQIEPEGCLSCPGVRGFVRRPYRVTARALNREGKPFEITGSGMMAKALCHETDHLDGKLFVERIMTQQELLEAGIDPARQEEEQDAGDTRERG